MNDQSKPGANTKWEELLGARELQEVHLAQIYAREFNHGTTGHNQLMLIAKLADMLNRVETNGVDIPKLFEPK